MRDQNTKTKKKKHGFQIASEYIIALILALFLALGIRGFVFEPFKIPSPSMFPTLMEGDHIFVVRYKYGLRLPFTKMWLTEFEGPKRGDVVVFTFPEDEDVDFIKRVVGLPGDKVAIKDGVIFVNDKPVQLKKFAVSDPDSENACLLKLPDESEKLLEKELKPFPFFSGYDDFEFYLESFDEGKNWHMIQFSKEEYRARNFETVVPERHYFVMGDNRDQSHDSRFWGMVPREYLKGKAIFIWLSLSKESKPCPYNLYGPGKIPVLGWDRPIIRWERFGRDIL